jgi:phage-related minor tail protein
MADDIQIKLGLDASQLFNGLDVALKKVNDGIKGLPDVGDAIASDLPSAQNKLNSFVNEQKQLLVALRLQGKEGSDSYAEIEKSIKEANVELKKMDDATKAVNASFQEVESSAGGISGVFEGLKGGLGDALSGGLIGGLVGGGLAGGIQAGIGAIVDGFGAVMDAGRGLISAQGDLQAQTGATGAEFEALKNAADEAFLGGVGESVAEATKIISNAKTVLKDALPTEQIGAFTAKAQALGNLYDKDVNEVISKSTPFIKQFGLDGETAFNLIALAAKEGKTSQDDVLDTLAEYSGLLDEAGFSAEEFTGALVVAGQEGLFNTDKIADSIKEAQIRLKAGDTAKAFTDIKNQLPEALGSTLGNLEQLASSGQITIKEFLQKSGESIKTAFDAGQISEAMTTQLQVAIAGTPAEEIGVDTYNKIFAAPIPTDEITKRATEAGQAASNAVGQYLSFDAVGRNLSLAFEKGSAMVVSGLSTTFGMIATAVGPTLTELGDAIGGAFERGWSIVKPILALIGGGIMINIVGVLNAAMVVITTIYDIWSSAFDAIVNALQPLIQVFKEAFGLDGALGEGMDVMQMFQDGLNLMTEIMREVGGIVADFGGLIIEFLITPLQTVIEVIADVVRSIAGWMQSNDENTESVKQSGEAVNKSKGFIDTLRQAFDNIRGTIGGVRESFIQIKTTIGEFWDAITQFDIQKALSAFTGFGDKLSDAYDKGFNATKEQIQKTNQVVKKGNEDAANEAAKAAAAKAAAEKLAKEKADAAEKERLRKLALANAKGKGAESESELQELKRFYKGRQDELENDIERELNSEKNRGKDKKALRAQLEAEANVELRKYLNERIGGIADANVFLEKNQLTAKITPSKKKGETVADIDNFYTQEMAKLSKEVDVKVVVDMTWRDELLKELGEFVKEAENTGKEYSKNLETLFKTPAKTAEELASAENAFTNFNQMLIDEQVLLQEKIQLARDVGDTKSLESLTKLQQANQSTLDDMYRRYARFSEDSAKEIEKSSGFTGVFYTFQAALNDAFNTEKIMKERELNQQIREERLGALDAEEDDLTKSLAKREISFEDYAAKIADIDKARQDAMEATETTFMERMKGVMDQTVGNVLKGQASNISGFVTDQFKDTEGNVSETGKIIGDLMGNLATQFGELALSGKATLADFAKSSVMVAYQALQQMIPIFIAEIAGKQFAELGLLGIAAAAGLTIVLNGLFAAAAPSLGFKDGVVGLEGPGDERSDSIPAWLSKGESVITAAGTKANRQELEWMNNNPGMSIKDYFTSNAPQVRYSVQEDGNLIQEVRKLREETRGLGKQINRNTHVEISGALVADNNSIKAVIERDRRRNARRG